MIQLVAICETKEKIEFLSNYCYYKPTTLIASYWIYISSIRMECAFHFITEKMAFNDVFTQSNRMHTSLRHYYRITSDVEKSHFWSSILESFDHFFAQSFIICWMCWMLESFPSSWDFIDNLLRLMHAW